MSESHLEHHGVKGMKWGVRNDDKPSKRSKTQVNNLKTLTKKTKVTRDLDSEFDKASTSIKKKLARKNVDPDLLRDKYELPPDQVPKKKLSKNQKLAIGIAAGVIGAAAIGYIAYRSGSLDSFLNKNIPAKQPKNYFLNDAALAESRAAWSRSNPELALANKKYGILEKTRVKAYGSQVNGLTLNWDNEVSLPSGSIIKRISSKAEKNVRTSGFFGTFLENDTASYKAVLPVFWKNWEVGDAREGGYINHYKASKPIKAPSGKTSVELFKRLLLSSPEVARAIGTDPKTIHQMSETGFSELLRGLSPSFADPNDLFANAYFKTLKASGYNAVIDFNDAGALGKTPLKLIDSSIFTIIKNEPLSFESIVDAANSWSSDLLHYSFLERPYLMHKSHLEHHGVKGMKWGVKKDEDLLVRMTGRRLAPEGNTKEERKASRKASDAAWKNYKKNTRFSERLKDSQAARASKIEYVLEEATKKKNLLIQTPTAQGWQVVMSGREFMKHLENGGYVNAADTNILYLNDKNSKGQ